MPRAGSEARARSSATRTDALVCLQTEGSWCSLSRWGTSLPTGYHDERVQSVAGGTGSGEKETGPAVPPASSIVRAVATAQCPQFDRLQLPLTMVHLVPGDSPARHDWMP